MEPPTANPSPTSSADSSALEPVAPRSKVSKGVRPASVDAVDPANTYAEDVAFLRARGCRCALMLSDSDGPIRAIPITGCDENGSRRVCPKRMLPQESNVGDN